MSLRPSVLSGSRPRACRILTSGVTRPHVLASPCVLASSSRPHEVVSLIHEAPNEEAGGGGFPGNGDLRCRGAMSPHSGARLPPASHTPVCPAGLLPPGSAGLGLPCGHTSLCLPVFLWVTSSWVSVTTLPSCEDTGLIGFKAPEVPMGRASPYLDYMGNSHVAK